MLRVLLFYYLTEILPNLCQNWHTPKYFGKSPHSLDILKPKRQFLFEIKKLQLVQSQHVEIIILRSYAAQKCLKTVLASEKIFPNTTFTTLFQNR